MHVSLHDIEMCNLLVAGVQDGRSCTIALLSLTCTNSHVFSEARSEVQQYPVSRSRAIATQRDAVVSSCYELGIDSPTHTLHTHIRSCNSRSTAANRPLSQPWRQIIYASRKLHARRVADRSPRVVRRRVGLQRASEVRGAQEHELRKRCTACRAWAESRAKNRCEHKFLR
jgi:GH24 family phage-related lysozyme (muramidase)